MKMSNKIRSAIKLLRSSGPSGVVAYILGRIIPRIYDITDKRVRQHPSSLSLEALDAYLRGLGIGRGSTLLVHSSWDAIKANSFRPLDLIEFLTDLVGPSGTIAMPSYTNLAMRDGVSFDVDRAPSSAGWITEIFRRMPGVIRSANVSHPVCALGPQASFLVDQHHLGSTPWDEYSPYFRIGAVRDSWVVGIGVGHDLRVTTSLHCVEGVLSNHRYFAKLFPKEIEYSYFSERHGSGTGKVKIASSVIFPAKIHRYFKGILSEESIGQVQVYAIRGRELIEKAVQIGLDGKVMHIWPVPWFWMFNSHGKSLGRESIYEA